MMYFEYFMMRKRWEKRGRKEGFSGEFESELDEMMD
jgi:hypothetical protein